MFNDMDDKKSILQIRLQEQLELTGKKATPLSLQLGFSNSFIRDVLRGKTKVPSAENLRKIAEALETTPEYLMGQDQAEAHVAYAANAIIGEKLTHTEHAKIPLYGHAVGGVDGEFVLNGNKLDDITAPPSLLGIHGAYAVTVSGDSMEPRYEDGETLFLDPQKRVSKGDYVVAQIQQEENGPVLAFIKRFVRHNSKELVLEQFNPPKLLTFAHENVASVDYVVMGGRIF